MLSRGYLNFLGLRLLVQDFGPLGRFLIAFTLWVIVLFATRRPALARDQFTRIRYDRDTLTQLRRGAWILHRSWLPINVGAKDTAFDFTQGLSLNEVSRIEAFAKDRASHIDAVSAKADQLMIAARKLALEPANTDFDLEFGKAANQLLQSVPTPRNPVYKDRPSSQKSKIGRNDAIAALHDLSQVLGDEKLPWFVLSGTFLGIVRENGFLPHDYDIDTGVMGDDIDPQAVIDAVNGSKLFVLRKVDQQEPFGGGDIQAPRVMLIKIVHKTGVPVDVFLHHQTPDGRMVHGSSLHHWFNSPFDLSTYTLEGVKVLGPTDADTYLTENYGDWRTPVTEFNCSTDTPNLGVVRHPVMIAVLLRRMVRSYAAQILDGPKLANELVKEGILIRNADTLSLAPTTTLWG